MNIARTATPVLTLVALASSHAALGQPEPGSIVQPVAVTTSYTMPFNGIGRVEFTADQSGLSQPYESGVTVFDSYVAATDHANNNAAGMLVNSNGVNQPNGVVELGETITIDLGVVLPVDALGLWASSIGGDLMSRVALYSDTDADFLNGEAALLATTDVERTRAGRAYAFPATETRFIHIEVLEHGGGSFLYNGEFAVRIADPAFQCAADTNGDGELTPGDFNSWVLAFNTQDPACDQNGDEQCTPGDFNAWIANFNAGCD